MSYFFDTWIKFFFLLTPFFVLSAFLTMTAQVGTAERIKIAVRVTVATGILCLLLYFAGDPIFRIFGITLDGFRVGAGVLLLLSGIDLVRGRQEMDPAEEDGAVVPLAIPYAVGPATIGAILVMGAESGTGWHAYAGLGGVLAAALTLGLLLLAGSAVQKLLGKRGLLILSKLTGLVLASLAAEITMTGLRNSLLG